MGLVPLFFLFFISLVSAQSFNTQASVKDFEFGVVTPSEQTFKLGSDVQLRAKVFNYTGSPLRSADGVGCYVLLVDENNFEVVSSEMSAEAYDFVYNVSSSLINEQKRFQYSVVCNSSAMGGYRTQAFGVTEFGVDRDVEQVALILSLAAAVFLFVFALQFKDYHLAFGSGFLFTIIGIYLFRFGYLGVQNFIWDSFAIVITGVGMYVLFRTSVEYMNEASTGG